MIDILVPSVNVRLSAILSGIPQGIHYRIIQNINQRISNRILFALSCDAFGMDVATLSLLRTLRSSQCLNDCVGAVVIDGTSEFYTKALAQDIVLSANQAGCLFIGKPLVEGTGSLFNQKILAAQKNISLLDTYTSRVYELLQRLSDFQVPAYPTPKILLLHASENTRSSTLWIGHNVVAELKPYANVTEISLQNGTIHDCRGCSYNACLHFAQNGTCFYGGAISETVLPAIRDCNALLFLCPNYNDAVTANITALFNRLTSLLLQTDLYDKYLYGIVVSGYSGSDIVAKQLLGAMCLNKTCMLPPQFCMMQTANDIHAAKEISEIDQLMKGFAYHILSTMGALPVDN